MVRRALVVIAGLAAALLLCAPVFAAGAKEAEQAAGAAGKSGVEKYFPVQGKKYTINWVSGASAPVDEDALMVKYWNDAFNVDIKIINIETNKYVELINLRFAAGDIPDRFLISPMSNLIKWKEQDILAEVPREAIEKIAPKLYQRLLQTSKSYFDYCSVGGKIYGFRQLRAPNDFRSVALWRRDWLKNVGINKIPETLDEAEAALYKFAKEDPDRNGKADTYGLSGDGIYAIFGAYGIYPGGERGQDDNGFWVKRDGKLVNSVVRPEMKLALEKLAKYYKDGVLDPEFITGENTGGYWGVSHAFIKGRIGMTNRGTWYHWEPAQYEGAYQGMNYTELSKIYGPKTESDILGYGGPLKMAGYESGLPQGGFYTAAFGFGKPLEKAPDRMGKMLTMIEAFTMDLDTYTKIQFGKEGVSYQMVQGRPVRIGEYKDIASLCKIGAQETFTTINLPEMWWATVSWGEDTWAKRYGFEKGGLKDELVMALPEVAKYSADLNKMKSEMVVQIITGAKPLSTFDDFAKKWYGSGGQEMEKAVNAWYSSLAK